MPILFGVILLDLIGFGIVIPILPFLSPQLGADKMDIALIIVTYAVCAGLSGPLWGRLSDLIGRKPVIMICLAGAVVAYVMLGLATQLWMVFVARGFAGLMALPKNNKISPAPCRFYLAIDEAVQGRTCPPLR